MWGGGEVGGGGDARAPSPLTWIRTWPLSMFKLDYSAVHSDTNYALIHEINATWNDIAITIKSYTL